MTQPRAANETYRLPPPLFDARCKACWFLAGLVVLVVASFASLDLPWGQLLSLPAWQSMARFGGEFFPPETRPDFLLKVVAEDWEAYETFLTRKLTTAPNVSHVKSALAIRTAKQLPGVPLE